MLGLQFYILPDYCDVQYVQQSYSKIGVHSKRKELAEKVSHYPIPIDKIDLCKYEFSIELVYANIYIQSELAFSYSYLANKRMAQKGSVAMLYMRSEEHNDMMKGVNVCSLVFL